MPQNDRRAVSGDLKDVVGGVGVRVGEESDDDFIDLAGILNQLAESGAVWFEVVFQTS